jgi:hypothetical protein
MVIYMLGVPSVKPTGNETSRELNRMGLEKVYATTFDTYEQEIRDQLQGLLGDYRKPLAAWIFLRVPVIG